MIEGANQLIPANVSWSAAKGTRDRGLMLYQRMSGDAEGNKGVFEMTGHSFEWTSTSGPLGGVYRLGTRLASWDLMARPEHSTSDKEQTSGLWRLPVAVSLAFVASACISPNLYASPVALPRGEVRYTLFHELENWKAGSRGDAVRSPPVGWSRNESELLAPGFAVRAGVGHSIDVGARLGPASGLGADVKFQLLREPLTLSVVPGAQVVAPDTLRGFTHLPLALGWRVSETTHLYTTVGASLALNRGSSYEDVDGGSMRVSGLMYRAGLGAELAFLPLFRVIPELTFLRSPKGEGAPINTLVAGIGFSWGGPGANPASQ